MAAKAELERLHESNGEMIKRYDEMSEELTRVEEEMKEKEIELFDRDSVVQARKKVADVKAEIDKLSLRIRII